MDDLTRLYNKLILGDARELEKFLPVDEPIVDLIITSPPYWDMKEYGKIDNQIGYGQSKEGYFNDLGLILASCFNVAKDSGSLWLISDTFRRDGIMELLPFDLATLAKTVGWKLRDLIIWDKQYALPWHQKGQMRNTSEFILVFSKSDNYKFDVDRIKDIDEISKWWVDFPERFNPKGKTPTSIWRFPIRRRGTWPDPSVINHFCPFPTGLVARIIELTTDPGDFVFDPFAGSGVVLAQAEQMSRSFFGLDVNPEYISMYKDSVKGAIAEEWEEIKKQRDNLVTAMEEFEQTVMKLRVLKYARQAIKAFTEPLKTEEITEILCAICLAEIPEEFDRERKISIEIWFLGKKNHAFLSTGLASASKRLAKPPLTHYGLTSSLFYGVPNEFLSEKDKWERETFYLYPIQKVRKFSSADTLSNWLRGSQIVELRAGASVPLLSNLPIDVNWAID